MFAPVFLQLLRPPVNVFYIIFSSVPALVFCLILFRFYGTCFRFPLTYLLNFFLLFVALSAALAPYFTDFSSAFYCTCLRFAPRLLSYFSAPAPAFRLTPYSNMPNSTTRLSPLRRFSPLYSSLPPQKISLASPKIAQKH